MHRILTLLAASLLLAVSARAADAPAYETVSKKSEIKFFAILNNAPVQGRFREFSADIRFDPEQPDKSHIAAEVNTGSIVVSHADAEKNIQLPEWLSTEKFPKASFKSKKITRMPFSDNYYAEGDMTIKGKTAPATLNFHLQQKGDVAVAKGFVTLKRSAYGIGKGEWAKDDALKDEVRVEFRIFAKKMTK